MQSPRKFQFAGTRIGHTALDLACLLVLGDVSEINIASRADQLLCESKEIKYPEVNRQSIT